MIKSIITLLTLISCAQSNYIRNTSDCPGKWKVFYNQSGEKITRKLSELELKDNVFWEARIKNYSINHLNSHIVISAKGEVYINENLIFNMKLSQKMKHSFKLLSDSKQKNHAQIIHFQENLKEVFNVDFKNFKISKIMKQEDTSFEVSKDFKKKLIINPRTGIEYASEYSSLSYRCEK